ncbi:formate dehydrogenase subunit gamma, partial [Citrobacter braakii]
NYSNDLMLSKTGFTHSDLLCWQSDYAGGSLNVNGTIMRDTYRIVEVLKGNEHKVADVGKYNAGQKMMFWSIMSLILVLLITGIIIWRPYFAHYFSINIVRWSLLIHATAAIVLIHAILIHMYMAFWVKGSIKGMIEGKVSRRWAKKHHPRWCREIDTTSKDAQRSRFK